MTYKIKQFDYSKMKDNSIIVLIGKRSSGKTTLVHDLLSKMIKCDTTIISSTENLNQFYSKHHSDAEIFDKYEPIILKKIIERSISMKPIKLKQRVVLDDCLIHKCNKIRELFFNGRRYGLTGIMTSQYILDLPPEIRSNIDYIFLFADNFITNREKLYHHFAGMFDTFDKFEQVFNELTKDYGCMVIDNTVNTRNIVDKVFWYKAESSTLILDKTDKIIEILDKNPSDIYDVDEDFSDVESEYDYLNDVKQIIIKHNENEIKVHYVDEKPTINITINNYK
jgi:hypothetical protein